MAKPKRAPKMPIKEPTDESASERWCHASAISASEFVCFAAPLVNQYIHSFITMDTTAAVSAIPPGTENVLYCPEKIFLIPEYPIPAPVTANAAARIIEATHSIRSCP